MRVQPSSPETELLGWNTAGELRIKLRSRPVEGAANRELVSALAGALGVPRSEITIEAGLAGRAKIVTAPAAARGPLLALPEL